MTRSAAPASRRRRLTRSLPAFSHRNYRLFFAGQAVSLVGTWMQQVAQAWLVLELSGGDPLWLGIVSAAQFTPVLVLGLFAGVLADAMPKRPTLVAVQIVMMILAAILAALTLAGVVEIWMVLVLAVALGVANAVDMPTRQAFPIEMVGPRDVGNAVALSSATFNGARVVGPAVAGLTIGAFGIGLAFAINAASFLAVIVGLSMMRDEDLYAVKPVPRPRTFREVRANLAEGLDYVRRTPVVLMSVSMIGIVATVAMNFSVVIPPYAQDVVGTDASGYGFLMTASGIGSLTAAIWLVFANRSRPIIVALGALVLGVASVLLALTNVLAIAMVLMAFMGFGSIAMAVTANTTMQMSVPDNLRGRVMSVFTTMFSASVPVGGILMGGLASLAGIPFSIAVGGVLSLLAGVLGLAWWRRIEPGWRASTATSTTSTSTPPATAPLAPADAPATAAAAVAPAPAPTPAARATAGR